MCILHKRISVGFRSEKAHDTMVDTCGDYRMGFWLIEDMKIHVHLRSKRKSLRIGNNFSLKVTFVM